MYGENVRREVLLSGIKVFERIKKNHVEGKRGNCTGNRRKGKRSGGRARSMGRSLGLKGKGGTVTTMGGMGREQL